MIFKLHTVTVGNVSACSFVTEMVVDSGSLMRYLIRSVMVIRQPVVAPTTIANHTSLQMVLTFPRAVKDFMILCFLSSDNMYKRSLLDTLLCISVLVRLGTCTNSLLGYVIDE